MIVNSPEDGECWVLAVIVNSPKGGEYWVLVVIVNSREGGECCIPWQNKTSEVSWPQISKQKQGERALMSGFTA